AVGRPRDPGFLGWWRRSLRGHELDGRGALHVAGRMLDVEVVREPCADRGQENDRARREQDALHRCSTAHTREQPCSRSRLPPPETGTYSPCGKESTTLPLRASTPTMRCANEPAYATPATTTAAP